MRRLLSSCLVLLAATLAMPVAQAATGRPGVTAINPTDQAIHEARSALRDYRGLREDLYFSRDARERASIQADMEQSTRRALEAIFALVKDVTTTTSPKPQILIYQTARDALGAGNRSGDVMKRVAYNVGALRAIAGQ